MILPYTYTTATYQEASGAGMSKAYRNAKAIARALRLRLESTSREIIWHLESRAVKIILQLSHVGVGDAREISY